MFVLMGISNVIKMCRIYCPFTLTARSFRYNLPIPGWTSFFLQICIKSPWHRLKKVLEIFLRDVVPKWHDSITKSIM